MESGIYKKNDDSTSVISSHEHYFSALNEYRLAKIKYYREVLRKQDKELIDKLNKIPDDWGQYDSSSHENKIIILDHVKNRLTDIKLNKTWELKYESLFLHHIVTVEEVLVDCLSFIYVSEDKLDEAIESINSIMVEIGSQSFNIKHLLLSLAKRSVSDLYYLMIAYFQFFKKRPFDLDYDFPEFCEDVLAVFVDYKRISGMQVLIRDIMNKINPYFSITAVSAGWRLDEFAMKDFMDKESSAREQMSGNLMKAINIMHSLGRKMKHAREFLLFYYNPRDGKKFRYNFIIEALGRKLAEGKISEYTYQSFDKIRSRFLELVSEFDRLGLEGFGRDDFCYEYLLVCLYKTGKVLEFFHLRAMMYEELNSIRNTILRIAEKELIDIREIRKRFAQPLNKHF